MSAESNAATMRVIYDAFSRGEYDRALEHVAEDVEVVFIPTGETFRGPQGFEEFMRGKKAAFPDVRIEITNQFGTEEYVISEFRGHGTHTQVRWRHLPARSRRPAGGLSSRSPRCIAFRMERSRCCGPTITRPPCSSSLGSCRNPKPGCRTSGSSVVHKLDPLNCS